MMEEIDFYGNGKETTNSKDLFQSHAATSTGTHVTPSVTSAATTSNNNNEPFRLPRTGGNLRSRGTFLRDTIKSQLPTNDQLEKTKHQAGKMFKSFGNHLNKMNLGKIIDKMEGDQQLADSMELLNSRMKEEVQRQEVRREAEELTMKVITEHLNGFLLENPLGSYEEWIQDLHPENANQGKLLSDIQQIDERFYVMESDHRKLWNDTIEKREEGKGGDINNKTSYAHRLVEARTQIWGKAPGVSPDKTSQERSNGNALDFLDGNPSPTNHDPLIDLLGDSNATHSYTDSATPASLHGDGIEEIDFFAPVTNPGTENYSHEKTCLEAGQNGSTKEDPLQDLFKF